MRRKFTLNYKRFVVKLWMMHDGGKMKLKDAFYSDDFQQAETRYCEWATHLSDSQTRHKLVIYERLGPFKSVQIECKERRVA